MRSLRRLLGVLVGEERDPLEKGIFHRLSLVPLLAWIGLGADGLSSACYGPAEAFHALGAHARYAPLIALLTITTVLVLARSELRIVQLFPSGGGGYLVASKLLGPQLGLVSGCALLIDYVLTVAVSIAACGDALFSLLPPTVPDATKPLVEIGLLATLALLNLRGMRESVAVLLPFFALFIATHAAAIGYGLLAHADRLPAVLALEGRTQVRGDPLAPLALLALVLRAYALGGGTYTGIEAVANSVQLFREPRVQTARRTLLYMSASLAFLAGGLLLCFLLFDVRETPGKTLNAVLFETMASEAGLPASIAAAAVLLALVGEATLLFVAAQAGMAAGPQVVASMAADDWLPRRFSNLSDRLVTAQGIGLVALGAGATLVLAGFSVRLMVVLYSINVFLCFALARAGLLLHDWRNRREPRMRAEIAWVAAALLLSAGLLVATVVFKLGEGGWIAVLATGALVAVGLAIRAHYARVRAALRSLDALLDDVRPSRLDVPNPPFDPRAGTAALIAAGFSGMGVHSYLTLHRLFPGQFRNFYFVTVGAIGASEFKSEEDLERLASFTADEVATYVAMAREHGYFAEGRHALAADKVDRLVELCRELARERPNVVFFFGKVVFERETALRRMLHNQTADYLVRRLQFDGLQSVVLPIRVFEGAQAARER
jgi:amino acid transporter